MENLDFTAFGGHRGGGLGVVGLRWKINGGRGSTAAYAQEVKTE
jgi:hypothetical protein